MALFIIGTGLILLGAVVWAIRAADQRQRADNNENDIEFFGFKLTLHNDAFAMIALGIVLALIGEGTGGSTPPIPPPTPPLTPTSFASAQPTSSMSQQSAPSPPATPQASGSSPAPTTAETLAKNLRYYVQLASAPLGANSAALASQVKNRLKDCGDRNPTIVNSNEFSGFNPGFLVAVLGPFGSKAARDEAAEKVRSCVNGAIPKDVTSK